MSGFAFLFAGFEWRTPYALYGLILLPLLILLRRRSAPDAIARAPLVLFFPDDRSSDRRPLAAGPALPVTWRVRAAAVPAVLRYIALSAMIIAVARPVSREPLPLRPKGTDIMLVLDLSSSMRATDLDPARNRLECAKAAASRFIEGRPADRIGIVGFARFADLVAPPTLDHRALLAALRQMPMVEADGPEDATGIGAAVMLGARTLFESGAQSKTVVLLTDGEENVASAEAPGEIAPVHAAQFAAGADVRVHTISVGIGNPGPNEKFVPIDATEVRRLAERTKGRHFTATDASAVDRVFAEIDRLERTEFDEPRFVITDRAFGFVLWAFICLFFALFLERGPLEVLP